MYWWRTGNCYNHRTRRIASLCQRRFHRNSIPEIDVYVRFCETDAAGHVSNISYFLYLEEARTKFFELIGTEEIKEKYSINFVVATTTCDFIRQVYARQILTLTTNVLRVGRKSFMLMHEILCSKTGELVARGSAVVVCFNFFTQQSVEIPPVLRSLLYRYIS